MGLGAAWWGCEQASGVKNSNKELTMVAQTQPTTHHPDTCHSERLRGKPPYLPAPYLPTGREGPGAKHLAGYTREASKLQWQAKQ